MTQSLDVRWPDHFHPRSCPIHVRNELDMAATRDNVWAWLVHATLWPTWYPNSTKVKILEAGPILQKGTRFRWTTFGVTINSVVLEYVPGERLAWDGRAFGIEAYHAWVLQPSARGCYVLTEETQHGWLARLGKLLRPNGMYQGHQLWLEKLESKARAGLPPAA